MKLFLREHCLLIILQLIQFTVIVGIIWLAGFRNMKIVFYSIFLSFLFLLGYLVYQYISRRKFYNRLIRPIATLDETLEDLDQAPISQALQHLLKKQYNQFQKQIIQLNEKQEEHLIFMDLWIHQMKTPLAVIELTAKELDEPDSSSLREEVDRIKNGLQTILYMSRLRTIEQDFQIKRVSLNDLVREISQENKRLFIRNQVYPKVIEQQEIIVESDEKWLFFMMNQLVHNAVKYSAEKSTQIIIKLYRISDHSVFEITDFGVGIPKEDMKRIFDAFYTGKNGRIFRESTGVGLYLTNEVAHYLGHQLEVESTVGEGTTFRITF